MKKQKRMNQAKATCQNIKAEKKITMIGIHDRIRLHLAYFITLVNLYYNSVTNIL